MPTELDVPGKPPTGPLLSEEWKLLETRPFERAGGRIVCVANQKGGVAKTTTSVNLAAALALRGHRILLVDIDPQANATTGVGLDHRTVELSSYDLLIGDAALADVARATPVKGLDCVPSSLDLAGAEIELAGAIARERKLAEALGPAAARYDLIFLDCPPSLGLLTINALAAAQDLIVPVQCEYYALEGLGQLLATAERVRRSLNPDLRVAGFLLTMYDARTKLSSQVADEVRNHFGGAVFGSVIPRSVRLSEAPSFGEPVVTLDPSSRGAVSYRLLATEVEERYGLEVHVPPPPPPTEAEPEPEPVVAARGPGGRGFGTVAAEPVGQETSWPRLEPWTVSARDQGVHR